VRQGDYENTQLLTIWVKFNSARPFSVYFVSTEGVGSHYEGHKYGTDELKT